ncbi:AMP-binding protein [Agilicoccus flavus]|uniref:AMP-binding protein n=1 Tax=Agilicoccus flavus TaxID=2775968 RepID=UPI001CF65519|nr:AMP-binding protein [Agilicoccus flavus]
MRAVAALGIGAGPAVLDALPAIEAALGGEGPLLVPHADGAPAPDLPPDTALDAAIALGTSGSTGAPKLAALSAEALSASATATHAALGGPGRWLLALPAHHVAGLQVMLRSAAAGVTPAVVDAGRFDAAAFVRAAAAIPPGGRRYTSLVPTQLRRVLADPAATDALAGFDAVLVGGAATAPDLAAAARAAGVNVVTTYGMSETAGGCVYDGMPLAGVGVRIGDGGRIALRGPTLAVGYLSRPAAVARGGETTADAGGFVDDADGLRWFVTDDVGRVEPDGRLVVEGRADDVVVTGGLKVSPAVVEAALRAVLPAGSDVVVLGVPDAEWGQAVGAALVPGDGDTAGLAATWPARRARMGCAPEAMPRRVVVLDALPTTGIGKPDRAALADLLASADDRR